MAIKISNSTIIDDSRNIVSAGIVTANSFVGPGTSLTGIVTSITAGTNITISSSTGNVTINASGGGGSGQFNTGITSTVQMRALTYETTPFTFPSTAGRTYVIESINVANVDTSVGVGTTVNIILSINNTSEQTYIAYNVLIVNGGLVDLLKQPVVANPSDSIKLWATNGNYVGVSNAVEVYMNYSEQTTTDYFGIDASTVSIASTDITTLYTSTTNPSVIQSIHLANRSDAGDYPVSVLITNGVTTTYLARDLVLPRYSTVEILERPKRVEVNGTIAVKVEQTSTIDVIISGRKITT